MDDLLRRYSSLVLYLLLFLCISPQASAQQCWFPDGITPTTDVPCQNTIDGSFAACCGFNQDGSPAYCLSNGLCWADMIMSRGSCTDRSWQSDACGKYCLEAASVGQAISPCSDTTWACSYNCSSTFAVEIGSIQLTDAEKAALGASTTVVSATATANVTVETLVSVATSTSACAAPSSNFGSTSPSTVGAAVGVTLGIALAGAILLWAFERRRYTRLRKASTLISYKESTQQPCHLPPPGPYRGMVHLDDAKDQAAPRELLSPVFSHELQSPVLSQEMP